MHSILWASILASAGVALVTTLLVEYLAKPGLEVRKERILENSRDRRDTIKQMARLYYLLTEIRVLYGRSKVFKDRSEMLERAVRISTEIGELLGGLVQSVRMPPQVRDDWIHTTGILGGFSMFFLIIQDLPDDKWQEVETASDRLLLCYGDLIQTSKWHLVRRHKLIGKIQSSPMPDYSKKAVSKQAGSPPSQVESIATGDGGQSCP